jgi:hypothetical protein
MIKYQVNHQDIPANPADLFVDLQPPRSVVCKDPSLLRSGIFVARNIGQIRDPPRPVALRITKTGTRLPRPASNSKIYIILNVPAQQQQQQQLNHRPAVPWAKEMAAARARPKIPVPVVSPAYSARVSRYVHIPHCLYRWLQLVCVLPDPR